jgi:hypothetical protein
MIRPRSSSDSGSTQTFTSLNTPRARLIQATAFIFFSFEDSGSISGSNRWAILEFAERSKSGLSGVGSVGYVNTDVFTILSYRPFLQCREIV